MKYHVWMSDEGNSFLIHWNSCPKCQGVHTACDSVEVRSFPVSTWLTYIISNFYYQFAFYEV